MPTSAVSRTVRGQIDQTRIAAAMSDHTMGGVPMNDSAVKPMIPRRDPMRSNL